MPVRSYQPVYRPIHACRSCGSERLTEVLNLGEHALSTFTRTPDEEREYAPLVLVRCENCTLVQLAHTADRERLYGTYWYRSATNPSMVAALKDVVDDALRQVPLGPGDRVLDIGANDGTLLAQYPEGVFRTAVEPARGFRDSLQRVAEVIVTDYFPPTKTFAVGFKPQHITSVAQFYNVEDPNAYVATIKRILHHDGVWVVQMQDLDAVVRDRAFDYVCHEHLALWDVPAFDRLLAAHGLEISGVSRNDVNGGSVRISVRHGHQRWQDTGAEVDWVAFQRDVLDRRQRTMTLLGELRDRGATVAGLAASTKGNTTLQFYGIGPDVMPFIADRNPDKVGTYTPTGQKVISEEEMRALNPEYLVALAWHFLPSFIEREAALLERGTRMITLLPELRVLGAEPLAKAA